MVTRAVRWVIMFLQFHVFQSSTAAAIDMEAQNSAPPGGEGVSPSTTLVEDGSSVQARVLDNDDSDLPVPGPELPDQHTGWLSFLVTFILGPNKHSNPIWRLRLLSSFCLVVAIIASVLFLPGDLGSAHSAYQRVIFIANFGAPVDVAVVSLGLSVWMAFNPAAWGNWPTGLSVANASITGGGLIIYMVLPREN